MKKISMLMALAVAIVLSSCGKKDNESTVNTRVKLTTDVDSLSFANGVQLANEIQMYQRIDSAQMQDFVKGMIQGYKAGAEEGSQAYKSAYLMGVQLKTMVLSSIDTKLSGDENIKVLDGQKVLAGLISTLKNDSVMTDELAYKLLNELSPKVADRVNVNKKAGAEFMANIAKKEGIKTIGDGIYYEVLVEGNGEIPADTSVVKVNYEGTLIDGTVFDSSYMRGEPATFPCNGVIPGWTKTLLNMPVGSTWMVYIPQEQAYGERGMGEIKPFSCLQFKIELLEIVKKEEAK